MMKPLAAACLLLLMLHVQMYAQLSPPGIDGAKAVAWGAIGFSQPVGNKWSVTAYVGGARQSNPNTNNPVHKSAILVINQEWLYNFNAHWQLAVCNSFRTQDIYAHESPYEQGEPGVRNELRYYLRLYYKQPTHGKVSFIYSFRPELRTFYTDNWDFWATNMELRFRLKGQANIPLNESKTNQLIIGNELLSAVDHVDQSGEGWSDYHFTEDRFANFFRHTFAHPAVIVDVGLMHQFWEGKEDHHVHYTGYLSFDVLVQHPFGTPHKS